MTRRYLIIFAFAATGLGGFAAGAGFKDWRLERCREAVASQGDLIVSQREEIEEYRREVERGNPK